MTRIPRVPNSVGDLLRWARDVNNYLEEIDPGTGAPNTLISRTTRGFQRSAIGGGEGGGEAKLQWKGQWDPTQAYSEGDIVRRNAPDDYDRGDVVGTYICLQDVGEHGPEPTMEDSDYWEVFAPFACKKIILNADDGQVIILNSRNDNPLMVRIGGPAEGTITGGSIELVQADTAGHRVKCNPEVICQDGVQRNKIIVDSDAY